MVASFYYKLREIGWIEKEIEIGQARPEANKTEVGINFIIQLSFQPDPCALNMTSFNNRFKSAFPYILIRITTVYRNRHGHLIKSL